MTMNRSIAALLFPVVAAGCADTPRSGSLPQPAAAARSTEPAGSPRPFAIGNPGFENPPRADRTCPDRWECTMHADPHSYTFKLAESQPAEGRQVLCIERVKNEPWALATQSSGDPALRGARVRLSMAVRVEGPGPMRAGPWLFVHGMQGRLAHQQRMVTVSPEWQRVSVEITVPQNVRLLEFGAMVYDGGRACVDDVRLEILGR